MHPREGWNADGTPPAGWLGGLLGREEDRRAAGRAPGSGLSRRGFLSRAAGAGLAAGGLGALLDACGSPPKAAASAGFPILNTKKNVTWPLYASNKAIASGLKPEQNATLKIFNWVAYVNQQCLNDFAKKYNCKVELTTFNTMTDALNKLASGQETFDVFMGVTADVIGKLVQQKQIRPLNHSYIPNIAIAWPDYSNPFYDRGWRYTVPYTIYTTGISWRKDYVHENPATFQNGNGWAFPWQAKYQGKVAILDDYRESPCLALMKSGIFDLNTTKASQIAIAQQQLTDLKSLVNVHIDNNDYTEIPSGQMWIHHAWSGDMAAAPSYMPKGVNVDVVGYWFPADGKGPVANDTMTILSAGQNPVLAHLFLNYMLNTSTAFTNIGWNGYMQPLTVVTPQKLVSDGILPKSLTSTVVLPHMLQTGLWELELPPAADAMWQQAWQTVSNGA